MENETQTRGNCSLYDTKDIIKVAIVNQALSALTVFACLFALSIIIIFKKWQIFSQRLIVYLIMSTMLISVTRSLARVSYDGTFTEAHRGFCIFIGYASQNTVLMPYAAILSITVYMFLAVVCNWRTDKYEWLYIFFIFVFPWTFTWIPFIKSAYGRAGAWCWIRTIDIDTCERIEFGIVLQLVLYYVPLFASLLTQVFLYLTILCKLHINKNRWKGTTVAKMAEDDANYKILRTEALTLFIYPLIYIVASLVPVINRIRGWASPGQVFLPLWYLTAMIFPLRGITFVLIFTLDASTRRRLTWSHLKTAIKNYNSKKVIMEYKIGEMESLEASYTQFTDDVKKQEPN